MRDQKQQSDEQNEESMKRAEENRVKREADAAARRKAEEEAAMPSEEKIKFTNAKNAEAKKLQGNEFYKKKDFVQALEHYHEAVSMNPDELLFYTNIAACHIEQKNFEEAIKQCDIAIERTKGVNYDFVKLAKVMARKASALEKSGDFDKALETYAAALLENKDSAIKDAMKQLEKKKKETDAKAYLNSDIAEVHKVKGTEFFKAGDFPAAVKEFDEGLRRDPTNVALYSNRSFAYIKLMEPSQGLRDANKALELDPTFVKGWARKGNCHQLMKEYHKAMEAFDKGLAIDAASKECTDGKMRTMNLI